MGAKYYLSTRGLSLPRNNVDRLTDRCDITISVYRGCKVITTHTVHTIRWFSVDCSILSVVCIVYVVSLKVQLGY